MKTDSIRFAAQRAAWALVVLCALLPGKSRGQATATVRSTWSSSVGYLGIDDLKCNCTFRLEPDGTGHRFIFRSEPIVLGVAAGSPAAGIVFVGDTIAEIDDVSLLTPEGAQRFASIRPGQRVSLIVRRSGNILKLHITAGGIDAADARAMGGFTPRASAGSRRSWAEVAPATPLPPRVPAAVTQPRALIPPVPAIPPQPSTPSPRAAPVPGATRGWLVPPPGVVAGEVPGLWTQPPLTPLPPVGAIGGSVATTVPYGPTSPRGWFGFSIRCTGCGWSAGPGEDPVWESDSPPELSRVSANSPAGRAGLKAGDRITHIDGVSILTPAGARRFGGVGPGQKVKITVLRNAKSLTRELTLGTPPEVRAVIAATPPRSARAVLPPSARRELRYTGKLDDVSVEVWSAGGPTVERVGDTMIITVGASVVRLKVDPKVK